MRDYQTRPARFEKEQIENSGNKKVEKSVCFK